MNIFEKLKRIFVLSKVMYKAEGKASVINFKRLFGQEYGSFAYKVIKTIITILFVVIGIVYSVCFGLMSVNVSQNLIQFSQLILIGIIIIILFFGVYNIGISMFYSESIPNYLAMPISSTELIISKILCFFMSMMLIGAMFIPAFIAGALNLGMSFTWVLLFSLMMLLSILPIASIALIITFFLLRYTALGNNEKLFKGVYGVFSTLVSVGIIFLIYSVMFAEEGYTITQNAMPQGVGEILLSFISPGYYLIPRAIQALQSGGFEALNYVAIFLLACVLYLFLAVLLMKNTYLDIVNEIIAGGSSKASKANTNSDINLHNAISTQSQFASFVKFDLQRLFRNPTLFQQYALAPVLMPVFVLIVTYFSMKKALKEESIELQSLMDIGNFLMQPEYFLFVSAMICAVAFGIALYTASLSYGYSAFSVEGKSFAALKAMPLDFNQYFSAKMLVSFLIGSCAPLLIFFIVLIVIRVSIYQILIFTASYIMGSITGISLAMFSDIMLPRFYAANEQELKNRPLNIILLVLFSGIVSTMLGIFAGILAAFAFSWAITIGILMLIEGIIAALSLLLLLIVGRRKLQTIEL